MDNTENQFEEEESEFTTSEASRDKKLTKQVYKKFVDKVFELRPLMKQVHEETSGVDLFSYSKRHIRMNKNAVTRARKAEVIQVIREKVKNLLGTRIADSVAKQLKGNDSISTAQHSGPFAAQFVMHSALQQSMPYFDTFHPNLQNVIILACSLVSFNNYSNPRGLLFHTFKEMNPEMSEIPFFGRAIDAEPVIFHKAYTHEAIDEALKEVGRLQGSGKLKPKQADNLRNLLNEIYDSPHVLSQETYHDQLTITNYHIFNRLFDDYKGKKPNLVFLSQEEIVLDLLLNFHLDNQTTLNKILTDPKMHDLMDKYFDKVPGAFSIKDKKGTFLFWAVPPGAVHKTQLWRNGNALVTEDGSYYLELKPEAIKKAIENHELIPSYYLVFFVLSFYYGLFLMGAFKQTHDLEKMLDLYIEMLKEYEDEESVNATEGLLTANLILPPSILYVEHEEGKHVSATSIDILINIENKTSWEEIFASYKNVSFAEVMSKMFPTVYNRSVSAKEKEEELASITEKDIDELSGFPKKIPSAVKFKY